MFGIITFLACAALLAADVHSSRLNNGSPFIDEANKFFRLANGDCDIKKLVIVKGAFLAVISVAAFALNHFGAGNLSFLVFIVSAIVSAPTVIRNYSLYRKYNKK